MRYSLLAFLGACLFFSFSADAQSQGKKKAKTPYWSDQKDAYGDLLPVGAIARIGTMRYRLPESRGEQSAVLSPDGKLFAALVFGAQQDDIEIWELPAWKRHRLITGRSIDKNSPQLQSLVFSADSKKLVTCDMGSMHIHFLDVATGKSLKKIRVPDKNALRDPFLFLARDEQTLIFTSVDDGGKGVAYKVIVWDVAKDKQRHSFSLPMDRFNGNRPMLTVSADGRWLANSVMNDNPNRPGRGVDSHIELWDLTTGKSARKIELEMPLPRMALSPDGKWLAASNEASLLRIYEVATGKEVHNIRRRATIQHLEFSPDGALYVADYDNKIQRWDAAKGDPTASWTTPPRSAVTQFAFPPQGKMLAMGMYADAVQFWEVETGKVFSPKDLPAAGINEVAFSPQGELFVNSDDGMSSWWNPRTGAKLRDLKLEFNDEIRGMPSPRDFEGIGPMRRDIGRRLDRGGMGMFVTMSRSGEFLASMDGGGVALFDVKTGKLLYDENAGLHSDFGGGEIVFLDGGAKAASVQNKKARIWNTRTGRDLSSFTLPLRDQEQSIRFNASATGKYFVVETVNRNGDVGGGRVLLWGVDEKKVLRDWPSQNGVETMCFSPDQQWLAVSQPQTSLQLTRIGVARADYDLRSGKNMLDVTHAVFSPDSRQLACATLMNAGVGRESSKIVIYEIYSKKVRLELVGHRTGLIDRLAYSPDGALLASGATDTTALVWKAGLRALADAPLTEDAPAADLDAWFAQMAGTNAQSAFQNMIKLARARQQTAKLLEEKIAPAKKPDSGEKTIKQWIGDLGSGQFATRTKANLMLQKVGPTAEPELRQALGSVNDIETRRRIEELLDRIALHEWTAEEVLHARAVEVLEAIGTKEARVALTRWTTGDPAAVLTAEARKALAALGK